MAEDTKTADRLRDHARKCVVATGKIIVIDGKREMWIRTTLPVAPVVVPR